MLPGADETITDAHHRFNAITALAEFLAEAANMHIERAGIAKVLVAPDVIEQVLSGHNPAAAF